VHHDRSTLRLGVPNCVHYVTGAGCIASPTMLHVLRNAQTEGLIVFSQDHAARAASEHN